MSQSTLIIDGNGDGRSVRLAVEAGMEAIASNNSGSAEPPRPLAYMWWADTANNLMKQRNAENSAWITIGPLDLPSFGLGDQVGDYKLSARPSMPRYLLCRTQQVSRATYAELFALIGIRFGAGDGVQTFNLPDPQGRKLVMQGQGVGLTNRRMGEVYGEERHTQTAEEVGQHTHAYKRRRIRDLKNPSSGLFSDINGEDYSPLALGDILPAGASKPFNVIDPSLVIGSLWIRALP